MKGQKERCHILCTNVEPDPDICPGGGPNTSCDPNPAPVIGKIVNSYLLHFDPANSQPQSGITITGEINFGKGEMVIGVITNSADLDATDTSLGLAPGITLPKALCQVEERKIRAQIWMLLPSKTMEKR